MSVIPIDSPPAETPELALKPVLVDWQLWLVAVIEVIFRASRFASLLATLAWIGVAAGFFIFDDWPREWFVFAPLIAAIASAIVWTVFHVIVLAPFRYHKLEGMAEKMEYRFYKDCFFYTVGDGKWQKMPYETLKGVELKMTKDRDIGHLRLQFEDDGKITFAARKIPNIRHAESACNDIKRLLDHFHSNPTAG